MVMKIADKGCIAPVCVSSSNPPIAFGRPATIPAKMMIDMPLPRPRSVICSPSHIRNIVPVRRVVTVTKRKSSPGSGTSPWDSTPMAMPMPWKTARTTVP